MKVEGEASHGPVPYLFRISLSPTPTHFPIAQYTTVCILAVPTDHTELPHSEGLVQHRAFSKSLIYVE